MKEGWDLVVPVGNEAEGGNGSLAGELEALRGELTFRMRQQECINRIASASLSGLGMLDILQIAEAEVQKLLGPVCVRFLQLYPGAGWYVFSAGGWAEAAQKTLLFFGGGALATYAYSASKPVQVDDFTAERRFAPGRDYEGLGSCIAVPIPGRSESWGVLEVATHAGASFAPYAQDFLNALGVTLGGVIERKSLELEAKNSDERMQLIMSASRDGVWDWNLDSGEVYWSDRLYDILGLQRTQTYLTKEQVHALILPEDLALMSEQIELHIRDKMPYELEIRMRHVSGQYKVLYARGHAILDEQGKASRMLGLITDMSELQQAGLRIEESESRFQTLADGIPLFIGMVDANGKALYYNKTCQDFARESSPQLIENSWLRYVHPDDVESLSRTFQEAVPRKKSFTFQYRIVGLDGDIHYLTSYGVPRIQPDGTFMGYVMLGLDVTEERLSSSRFKRLYDSNMIGVLFTTQGHIDQCNDAFLTMLGYTRADFEAGIANNLWDLTPPESIDVTLEGVERYRAAGVSKTFEKKYIHKDGHYVDVLVSIASLVEGDTQQSIVLVSDLSEQKKLISRLQRLMDANLTGIVYTFADGVIDECNDAFLTMLGYTRDDWENGHLNFWNLICPDFQTVSRQAMASLETVGAYPPFEVQCVHKNGAFVDVLMASASLPGEGQGACVTLVVDITVQKRLTAKLQRIMDANLVGIIFARLNGDIVESNDVFLNMLAYSREDMYRGGLNFWDLTPPEYKHICGEAVETLKRDGFCPPFEKQYVRQDGRAVDVLVALAAMGPNSTSDALAIVFDITDRKTAERALKRTLEREQLTREILEIAGSSEDIETVVNNAVQLVGRYFKADQVFTVYYFAVIKRLQVKNAISQPYLANDEVVPFSLRDYPPALERYIQEHFLPYLEVHKSVIQSPEDFFDVFRLSCESSLLPESECERLTGMIRDEWTNRLGIRSYARFNIEYLGKMYGSLSLVHCGQANFWSPGELDVLGDVVNYLGSTFYQMEMHLHEQAIMRELQRTLERERLNRSVLEITSRALEVEQILSKVTTLVGLELEADRCTLILFRPLTEPFGKTDILCVEEYRSSGDIVPFDTNCYSAALSNALSDAVGTIQSDTPYVCKSLNEYYEFLELALKAANYTDESIETFLAEARSVNRDVLKIRSYVRYFIAYRGILYGTMVLHQCDREDAWGENDLALLEDVAKYLGAAFYQLELHEQEQLAKSQLELALDRERLNRAVLETTNQSQEAEPMVQTVTEVIGRHFGADRCLIVYYESPPDAHDNFHLRLSNQYRSSDDIASFSLDGYSPALVQVLNSPLPDSLRDYADRALDSETFFESVMARFRAHGMPDSDLAQYHQELRDIWHHRFKIRSFARTNITYRGRIFGSIALHHCTESQKWNESDLDLLADNAAHIGAALYQMELHEHEQFVMRELEKSYRLIHIISEAQAHFITSSDNQGMFRDLLNRLLAYTDSEFGFIGEVLVDAEGHPYLKTRFMTELAETPEGRGEDGASLDEGLAFRDLKNLFAEVMTTGQLIISNDPANDPRGLGWLRERLSLNNFMGLPLYRGEEMVGMMGIANRAEGFTEALASELHPYLVACSHIIGGVRNEALRKRLTQELRLSERAMKSYASRLERSNNELEQFATIASHDLQAPLRKVILFSDYLKTSLGENLSQESQDYMVRIQKATRKMQQLITDLLVLSRVSRKAKPFVPVDLKEIVEDVLSDLEEGIREAKAQVHVSELPVIDADGPQLHQVFQNLMGNALKFQTGKTSPDITISAQMVGDNLCEIQVKDNGIGFDEKYLDRIFTVFERLHSDNEYEGTGMGLAIVHKIVERHGGSVTAKSQPGQGSTFIVTLPVHQP